MTTFRAFYDETVRPDLEQIVEASGERRRGEMRAELAGARDDLGTGIAAARDDLRVEISATRDDLRAEMSGTRDELRAEVQSGLAGVRQEMREGEGRLRFEIRDGDRQVREGLEESIAGLRRDMNGHFDAVHHRLGHLETEYRMLVVGVRRLEAARPGGESE